MSDKKIRIIKYTTLALVIIAMIFSGLKFYNHRNYKEPVILGPGVTKVETIGDYYEPVKGTVNDCNIYFLDSGKPGGTVMIMGSSHPEEPATNLTAEILVENAVPQSGRLIVVIRGNSSASKETRPGEAYPMFYEIETEWGSKKYRMGSRWSSPLDSWPDPEVYTHYPSGQMLSYQDIRNINRCWPGKPDGLITEQTCYAFTEFIKEQGVDLFIDLHEAELEYTVINTIVAHQKGNAIAAMASMTLTAEEFDVPIGMEYSPKSLHGLSHREIGDNTQAVSLLFEVAEPMLDRVRGITDEELLLRGNDPFVRKAGEYGLLYSPMPENGWPIEVRVGRHCSTILESAKQWSLNNPGNPIEITGVPKYAEVKENGVGYYFDDPSKVSEDKLAYE